MHKGCVRGPCSKQRQAATDRSKKFDRASFTPRQAKKGRRSEWPVDVLKCRQRGVEGGARICSERALLLICVSSQIHSKVITSPVLACWFVAGLALWVLVREGGKRPKHARKRIPRGTAARLIEGGARQEFAEHQRWTARITLPS